MDGFSQNSHIWISYGHYQVGNMSPIDFGSNGVVVNAGISLNTLPWMGDVISQVLKSATDTGAWEVGI